MKICAFAQCYNELSLGNLKRWLDNTQKYADYIAVYDDGSTDGSADFLSEQKVDLLIRGGKNDFINESRHRAQLLWAAKEQLKPDWFVWTDVDEVLDKNALLNLRKFLETAEHEGYELEGINLWRSGCWRRLDYIAGFNQIAFWRNNGELTLPITDNLHGQMHPNGMRSISKAPFKVIHYGYSTADQIARRWVQRTRLGVPKQWRERCVNEAGMQLEHVSHEIFPDNCVPKDCGKPSPISYDALITKWEEDDATRGENGTS